MNNSMISSSVSMQALQQKMDIIAHNIANSDTLGFKRKDSNFHDVFTTTLRQPEPFRQPGRLTPLGFNMGWGAKVGQIQIDMTQGSLQMTGNMLDVAIEGDALFEIRLTDDEIARNENGQTVAWTKQGSFQFTIQPNDPDYAYLTTSAGQFVLDTNDEPVRIPKNHRVQIDSVGNIMAYDEVNRDAPPEYRGQLKVVHVLRPQLLEQIGDKQFVLKDGVDNANGQVLTPLNEIQGDLPNVAIRQGFVEKSNVDLATEMTDLMMVQRAFQLNSRALVSADSMWNITNNLRG